MLDQLRDADKDIHNGMLLVEDFHRMLERKNPEILRPALAKWYRLVRDSGIAEFRKFAGLIREFTHEQRPRLRSRG